MLIETQILVESRGSKVLLIDAKKNLGVFTLILLLFFLPFQFPVLFPRINLLSLPGYFLLF